MSIENDKKVITNGEEKNSFVVQKPEPSLRVTYLNNIVNTHMREDVFSQENYEKMTKDPLFTKIILALDDSIERVNDSYEYLKEFLEKVKNILNIDSVTETLGFWRTNKDYINKLYHNYLKKYKEEGLQSITMQQKNGANYINLNDDMTRVLLDRPMTDHTKSLILTILLHAIMLDECSQEGGDKAKGQRYVTI